MVKQKKIIKNNMKRILALFTIMFLTIMCGTLKERTVIESSGTTSIHNEEFKNNSDHISIPDHTGQRVRNAFTTLDLYRKRENIIANRKSNNRTVKTKQEPNTEESEVIVTPRKFIEIIQVVDENGNIVANKRVK